MKKNITKILNQQYIEKLFKKRIKQYFPSFASKKIKVIKIKKVSPVWAKKTCLARYLIVFSDKTKKIIRASARIDGSKKRTFEICSFIYKKGFNSGEFQIPKPLDYIEEAGAFFYQEATGAPLAALMEKNKVSPQLFEKSAELLFKLHSLGNKSFKKNVIARNSNDHRKIFQKIKKYLPELSPHLPSQKEIKLVKQLDNAALADKEKVFLHGDLYPGNIIIEKRGRIMLIDFDKTGIGPCYLDLAAFIGSLSFPKTVWPLSLSKKKKIILQESFLKKYCQLSKLDYQKTKKELNKYLIKIFFDQVYFFSSFIFEGWREIDQKTKNYFTLKIKDLLLNFKNISC